MLKILKDLLGLGSKVDLKLLMKEGAQIADVRTEAEYKQGNFKGSINNLSSVLFRVQNTCK